jgi:hypothetical protein
MVRTSTPRTDVQGYILVHLTGIEILDLRKKGILKSLPTMRAHQIKDMSSSDMFIKAAAIGQVTWMVVQVVARREKGLPVSQLEIEACALLYRHS